MCLPGPYYATGCYRRELNNNVARGCVSELQGTPILEDCHVGEVCKICNTDGCNSKVNFQECYNCNSDVDSDCLRVQNNTSSAVICHDYMDSCVQMIQDVYRITLRGCTNEIDSMHNPLPSMRLACTANFCNSNIYPIWRATCHQCDSGEGCNRNSTETTEYLMPCKIFWQDDQCYSVLRDRQAVRGCLSDADANVAYCQESDICESCIQAGCNFRPASRPPALSCVSCQYDEACSWGFPVTSGESCEEDVWMGEVEGCYTGVRENGDVVRGCSLGSAPCPTDHECNHCQSNNCNSVAINRQECIHCRSDANGQESCAEETAGLEPRQCSGDHQTFQLRGCYTMRKPNDIVIRGCMRDLSSEDIVSCQSDDHFCNVCLEQGCNIGPAPAKAAIQHPFFLLILLSSIMLFRLL
ncbi:uncharacterized protein LOC132262218 [Phlebotomus argentipes]|uniref:uncharacterized protein LOC132262218 n=1 Tax=Phlebotomus argentipes TaxID=94469 RepID=UPI002892F3A3|nr:uncharacterized protein LOC132262218 [Phlebotomus argentipes]